MSNKVKSTILSLTQPKPHQTGGTKHPTPIQDHTTLCDLLTHVVLAVAFVGGDPLHGELGHAQVLGHRHRTPLPLLLPRQQQLLRRLRNWGKEC